MSLSETLLLRLHKVSNRVLDLPYLYLISTPASMIPANDLIPEGLPAAQVQPSKLSCFPSSFPAQGFAS